MKFVQFQNTGIVFLTLAVISGLLAGCVNTPAPTRANPVKFRALLLAPEPQSYTPKPWTNTIPWEYPIPPTGFCWELQISTNLVTWETVPAGCVTDPMYAAATNAVMFFRLKGTMK